MSVVICKDSGKFKGCNICKLAYPHEENSLNGLCPITVYHIDRNVKIKGFLVRIKNQWYFKTAEGLVLYGIKVVNKSNIRIWDSRTENNREVVAWVQDINKIEILRFIYLKHKIKPYPIIKH